MSTAGGAGPLFLPLSNDFSTQRNNTPIAPLTFPLLHAYLFNFSTQRNNTHIAPLTFSLS